MSHVPTVLKSDRSVFDKMLLVDDNGVKCQLTMLFKIINDLVDIPLDQYLMEASTRTRPHHSNKFWPRKYAHSSFSSLVQSLLPKDNLLRNI